MNLSNLKVIVKIPKCCYNFANESGGFMTREDEIAAKAKRASTLKSLNLKKKLRLNQLKEEYQAQVRNINIQFAEDPERLKAKYAADDYAKNEKAKAKAAKRIEKEQKRMEIENKIRPFSLGEEIFSSVVQGIGAALFIAATALLDVLAIEKVPASYNATNVYFLLYTLFGVSMILNYVMSTLYHGLPEAAKEPFRRLCRIAIYFVIASSFTIYSFTGIKGGSVSPIFGIVLNSIVAAICVVGIFITAIGGKRFEVVNIIFFSVLGWSGLIIFAQLFHVISTASFSTLIISGVIFTLGLVFSSIRKIKFMHAIGNLVILCGSVLLFFSFFFMF